MNSIFKKSAIAIAIIGLTSTAYAGTVTGFFAGAEGLDLQVRNGDLDFVTVFPASGPSSGDFMTDGLHPHYAWDWRVYAGLNFCGGDDLTVSWLRFHTNDHEDFGTPVFGSSTSPLRSDVRFLGDAGWSDIFAKAKFDLDEVYGVFAHTAQMGAWSLRFGGGVEWARLNTDFVTDALDTTDTEFGYDAQSDLRGVGPRIELDAAYHMPYNLSVFARTNMALLIATRDIDLTAFDPDNDFNFEFDKRHVVVPKFGIKLGVGYTCNFGAMGGEGGYEDGGAMVTLEAGWQVESYVHAIERPEGFGRDERESANLTTKTSNYGYQGLFIGAKLSTGWF